MEYSRLPNYVGRKENNPFSSKEDNWIIRDENDKDVSGNVIAK